MKIVVSVRGRLKGDEAQAKRDHDAAVDKLIPVSRPLGAVGHQAFLNPQDRIEFMAIDTWNSMEGLQKFMGDPNTQAEIGKLFESQPSVSVWVESGWRSFQD